MPALAVWVCTMSGRNVRIIRYRAHSACASDQGRISRPRPGTCTQRTPLAGGEVAQVAFLRRLRADGERRRVAERFEPGGEQDDVDGGASDVQPGEDAQHADVGQTRRD